MAKITKLLSSKVRTDGKSQVLVSVFESRTNRFRVKCPVFVTREFFNEENGEITIPKKNQAKQDVIAEAARQKAEFDTFMSRLTTILSAGTPSGEPLSKEWVEHVLALQDNKTIGLKTTRLNRFDIEKAENEEKRIKEEEKQKEEEAIKEANRMRVADAVIAYRDGNSFAKSRFNAFKVLSNLIIRFELYKSMTSDPGFKLFTDTMTPEEAAELREYVATEYQLSQQNPKLFAKILKECPLASNPKRPRTLHERGNNYVIQVMKALKAMFNWLFKTGQTDNQPFKRMIIGEATYGTPIYITVEERNKIAGFDLSDRPSYIQTQRDIFIFQCLVGCRVGDLSHLTWGNITMNMRGNYILEYIPSKTDENKNQVKPRVPLSPTAIVLIEKYKGIDPMGRLFPFTSDQHYNDAIKEVFEICGITRNVIVRNSVTGKAEAKKINEVASSHMARRTFVGAAYKVVKDPNLIGAMSGHVPGSAAFNRYRAIDDDDLSQVIGMIG